MSSSSWGRRGGVSQPGRHCRHRGTACLSQLPITETKVQRLTEKKKGLFWLLVLVFSPRSADDSAVGPVMRQNHLAEGHSGGKLLAHGGQEVERRGKATEEGARDQA